MEQLSSVIRECHNSLHQQLATYSNEKFLTSGTISICLGVVVLGLYKWYQKHRKLPPGPSRLYFSEGGILSNDLTHVRESYGDVSSVRVWNKLVVQLNSVDAIREAFHNQGEIFSGRVSNQLRDGGIPRSGVAFSEGDVWKERRRFILSSLRDFGFGKNVMERVIQDEALQFVSEFEKQQGKALNPTKIFGQSVANVISGLIFGERLGEDDLELFGSLTKILLNGNPAWSIIIILWKLLILLPGDHFKLKKHFATYKQIFNYINNKIDEHRKTFDGSTPTNLIDAYLLEVQRLKDTGVKNEIFTDEHLAGDILHLFLAGSDTTQATLCWAVLLMAVYPDVQAKVQAEIDEHIGDKLATLSDRPRVRYTEAVIHEVERWATIGAVALPHRLTEDTTLKGYSIPGGSIVLANLLGVHRDASIWPYANTFNPDNFLDEKGNLKNLDSLVAFSLGKRSCLGESLAKQELFIMFVTLMQRFRVVPEKGKAMPSIHLVFNGILRTPPDFDVVFLTRKS